MKRTDIHQGRCIKKLFPVIFDQISVTIVRTAVVSFLFIGMIFILTTGLSQARDADKVQGSNLTTFPSASLKTIIVKDYYPYTFVNDKGIPDGFSVDIAKAAAGVMGLKLEISVDTWANAIKALGNGTIGMLPMMAASPERDKIFDFSVPHTIAYDAVFLRNGAQRISSLKDLADKTVIVMNKDAAHDYLLSSGMAAKMKLVLVDSLPDAFRTLAAGKGDAALMPKLVGLIVVKKLNLTNLDPSPVVIDSYNRPFCFAVKQGDQFLLERLSQGLSIIKATGQYQEIYKKWFGALEPPGLSRVTVIKYIAGIAAVSLLIGLGLIIWNVSLRNQVALRTEKLETEIQERLKTEVILRESEEQYRNLFENAAEAIYVAQDGKLVFLNPMTAMITGYSGGELMTRPFTEFIHPDDRDMVFNRHVRRIKGEELPHIYPFRIIHKDGNIRWVELNTVLMNWKGKPATLNFLSNITERKLAEEERKAHLHFLESLKRVDQAIKQEPDVEQMLWNVIKTVFSIFDCDRTWLLYPCDPDAPSFRVPVEITRPEYPGAKVLNIDVPMSPGEARNMREALESDEPVTYIAGTERPIMTAEQFGVQSQMFISVYPKSSKPWVFGMHQCSYPRIWTEEEQILFREIARRISDGLSSVLFLRELQESEGRYHIAEAIGHVGNWEYNLQTTKFWGSDEAKRIYGFDPEALDFSTDEVENCIPERERVHQALFDLIEADKPYNLEFEIHPKNSLKPRIISSVAELKRDEHGNPLLVVGVIQDITERKQAEEELRKNEEKFRNVFDWANDAIMLHIPATEGAAGRFIDMNQIACRMLGYSRDELLTMGPADIVPTELHPLLGEINRRVAIQDSQLIEIRLLRKDGTTIPVESSAHLITYEGKRIWLSHIRDITERKHAEEELRTSRSQLRALATRLQQIREYERIMIAREIHDEMGGGLTGLKMDLSWVLRKMSDADPCEERVALMDKIHKSNALIDHMIHVVRRISTDLRPSVLDDLGLIAALEWQLSEFTSRTEIQHEFIKTFDYVYLEQDTSVAVFRIFQEALTNVARHSRATKVAVVLREGERSLFGDESLVLEIRDNGRGITEEEILNLKSLGLLGMKERVLAFGGELSIYGEPGGGTSMVLKIPRKRGEPS